MQLFLSSYEYADFAQPRKVLRFQRVQISGRKGLAIDVDIPVDGNKYGNSEKELRQLFLLNRIDEDAFDSFKKFPVDVFVLIKKGSGAQELESVELNELKNIAWACLYNNEKDAIKHKFK